MIKCDDSVEDKVVLRESLSNVVGRDREKKIVLCSSRGTVIDGAIYKFVEEGTMSSILVESSLMNTSVISQANTQSFLSFRLDCGYNDLIKAGKRERYLFPINEMPLLSIRYRYFETSESIVKIILKRGKFTTYFEGNADAFDSLVKTIGNAQVASIHKVDTEDGSLKLEVFLRS